MTEATMKQVELQDGASADLVQENMQHLEELFPDAFTENANGDQKVNFETLRQLLGDLKVLDEGEEKYGLNWHGKKQARQIALTPSLGTLLPCPEESVGWDTTQNLFIEGDNLEVLKLLQKSYANKVKMIYIDPPYNTGKEFVYPDKFQDNLDTYLKYTGQKSDEGLKFTSNTETGGRKHTNWLNMMYPRLKLARSFLKQDGCIIISIDENEQANLKQICDEIFGEENFIGQFIWKNRTTPNDAKSNFAPDHEYLLVYAKNGEILQFKGVEKDLSNYTNTDNDPNGPWIADNPSAASGNYTFEIQNPHTGDVYTPPAGRYWAFSEKRVSEWSESGKLVFPKEKGKNFLLKKYLSDLKSEKKPLSSIIDGILTSNGTKEMKALYEEGSPFKYPKPSKLIKLLIEQICDDNDIVIDFFAGSGTTAHAIMKANVKCKFILVQLPELVDEKEPAFEMGYKTISDITIDRMKRVGNTVSERDKGFKVFKLSTSNIKVWNPDRTDLEGSLLDHKEHLVEGRSEQDILYELLLKRGVDLTTPIETREIARKNVYSIGYGKIITCLDDLIAGDDVEPLAAGIVEWQKELKDTLGVKVLETHVFFKDSAFRDDVAKTNMAAILSQNGIDHVRSL